jgi:tetratricopeptide (TPR) repeat protein
MPEWFIPLLWSLTGNWLSGATTAGVVKIAPADSLALYDIFSAAATAADAPHGTEFGQNVVLDRLGESDHCQLVGAACVFVTAALTGATDRLAREIVQSTTPEVLGQAIGLDHVAYFSTFIGAFATAARRQAALDAGTVRWYGLTVDEVVHGETHARLAALTPEAIAQAVADLLRRSLSAASDGQVVNQPSLPVSDWFVDPTDLLGRLRKSRSRGSIAILAALAGQGGVGKSTFAAQYFKQSHDVFKIRWWLRAAGDPPAPGELPVVLVDDITALGRKLGLVLSDDQPAHDRVSTTFAELAARPDEWLLVFDNVDHLNLIEPIIPTTGCGQVVVTTRVQTGERYGQQLDVGCFKDVAGGAFLLRRSRRSDPASAQEREDSEALSRYLGGLPIALEQAGAMLGLHETETFASYLGRLQKDLEPELDRAQRLGDYPVSAYGQYLTSIADAGKDAPRAVEVLQLLSWFDPDTGVPLELARRTKPDDVTDNEFDDAIDALVKRSLIRRQGDAVVTHRLVQRAMLHDADAASEEASFEWACNSLLTVYNTTEFHLVAEACRLLEPHSVTVAAAHHPTPLRELLCDRVATWLVEQGDLKLAIPLHETTLANVEQLFGPDHPNTLSSRTNLAAAYEAAGDLGRAIPLFEATLADRERVFGADHPNTLSSRNNLAYVYASAGDLGRAIPLYEMTLASSLRMLGADDSGTLTCCNNLADAYEAAGDLGRAIPLFEATLADRERVFGADHPNTLSSRNNLASAYRSAGDLGLAIPLYEMTLASSLRVLGADHPNTLTTCNNLAASYASAGDLAQAIALYEMTLADRERVLGPDHPDTLASRNNLASAVRSAGDLGRAIPLYAAAVADFERVLGPDHPNTLTSRNNLSAAINERDN